MKIIDMNSSSLIKFINQTSIHELESYLDDQAFCIKILNTLSINHVTSLRNRLSFTQRTKFLRKEIVDYSISLDDSDNTRNNFYIMISSLNKFPDEIFDNKRFVMDYYSYIDKANRSSLEYDQLVLLFKKINRIKLMTVDEVIKYLRFIPKSRLFDFVNSNVIKFNFDLVEFFNKFVISYSFINSSMISTKKEYVSNKLKCLSHMDYNSLRTFIKNNPEIVKEIYLRDDFIKAVANIYDPIKFRSLVILLTDHFHVDCYEMERIKKSKLTNSLKDNISGELPNSFNKLMLDVVENPDHLERYKDELNPAIYSSIKKILDNKENDNEWKCASIITVLKKEYTLDLTFSIMDCLFGDFYKNVLIDVNELVKNKDLIEKSHYNFYNSVLNFVRYNNQKKIEFYFTFKDMDIRKMLYNDIRKVKNILYKDIVDKSLKLDKKSSLYQASESRKNNIDIYRLGGEDFQALVRCHPIDKPMYVTDRTNISDSTVRNTQNLDSDGYSFQLISSQNLTTYVNPKEFVTLLYSNIDYNNIVHINRDDSFSSYDRLTNDYGSDYANELSGSKDLIADSEAYCEIVIANTGSGIKPDAVVCYDRYTDYDLMLAKRLGIPVLVIDTTKYKFNIPEAFNEDRIKYARSAEDAFSDQSYVTKFSRK